ncbi:hypothetical protein A2130_02610 [Candidatus Woesebacteria bacterium GWC2_33_12]|nr:MAG: hypothetical protein A2130_02610 [Candidatus Woesebacteria bacterium GWC2_33_12]OGM87324.1 MAG: hypothetical protein A2616_01590 [Candidatus Woesebacteria bacterium RIFOXYD1_FULL_33_11]
MTLTTKGQVTIPIEARIRHQLAIGTKIAFFSDGDYLKLKPVSDLISLRGSVKQNKNIPLQKLIKLESDTAEKQAVLEYLERVINMNQ